MPEKWPCVDWRSRWIRSRTVASIFVEWTGNPLKFELQSLVCELFSYIARKIPCIFSGQILCRLTSLPFNEFRDSNLHADFGWKELFKILKLKPYKNVFLTVNDYRFSIDDQEKVSSHFRIINSHNLTRGSDTWNSSLQSILHDCKALLVE